MKVILSKKASFDIENIILYISQDNIPAAIKVKTSLFNATKLISSNPYIGRPTIENDVRIWKVSNLPYLIPYQIIDNEIEILRFYHTARNRPENWK